MNMFSLGVSRLIRYGYGGALFAALVVLLFPNWIWANYGKISGGSSLIVGFGIFILSAGVYALHRSVVIPVHHLVLCFMFWFYEVPLLQHPEIKDSVSPTRFLGGEFKVRRGWRIAAYSALRRRGFFYNSEQLDIAHAENGMLVMTAVGMFVGFVLTCWCIEPGKSVLSPTMFAFFGFGFLLASYVTAFSHHAGECLAIKKEVTVARTILRQAGFID